VCTPKKKERKMIEKNGKQEKMSYCKTFSQSNYLIPAHVLTAAVELRASPATWPM